MKKGHKLIITNQARTTAASGKERATRDERTRPTSKKIKTASYEEHQETRIVMKANTLKTTSDVR